MTESRRVSASRLAAIEQCTMKYYLHEICDLPEKQWSRTAAGSCTHSILELLRRDRRRDYHDIVKAAQTIYAIPAMSRLVRAWAYREKMAPSITADIDAMCMVAINHSNFLDEDATERFEPEHEFNLTLENGAVLKGFIDRLARYTDVFRIHDYKSARNKKTKAEVANNYQSLAYQLYVWLTHGVLADVRYYFLRHPPTKLHPNKHLMITPPATPAQLRGFSLYVQHMWEYINNFGPKDAESKYCEDTGFCDRVCSYRRPFSYMVVTKPGAEPRKYWIDPKTNELPYEVQPDETSEILSHPGCPRFNHDCT